MSSAGPQAALAAAAIAGLVAAPAVACDLRLDPSPTFGGSCQIVVGYAGGARVGPFHITFPDGSMASAGTCEGYVAVDKIEGNRIWTAAFHTFPAQIFTLADDCKSGTRNRR